MPRPALLGALAALLASGAHAQVPEPWEYYPLGVYDVRPLLDRGVFRRLTEPTAFAAFSVDEMGGVVWEAVPDRSRDTVYLAGEPA